MVYDGDLPYQEVKKRILAIEDPDKQLLLCLTYATGSRVGEIVRHKLDKKDTIERNCRNPPLKDIHIYTKKIKGKTTIAVRIQVEKSIYFKTNKKTNKVSRHGEKRFRVFPIPPKKEIEFCRIIWKAKKERNGYLLNISTRCAEKWFSEVFPDFGEKIHHLRHWRITHLLSGAAWGKPVPKDHVQKLVGHSRLTTTNLYDHIQIEDWMGEYA